MSASQIHKCHHTLTDVAGGFQIKQRSFLNTLDELKNVEILTNLTYTSDKEVSKYHFFQLPFSLSKNASCQLIGP